ncbi:MAG: 6-carboxytetrahydropterin synthase [Lachnospiraceae bacterium]|nr:6-carboxytetrahydropterin synthase [Lachnospiraceae bacterium]
MKRTYKWQFHFNAMHNITPELEEGKHTHSFLVILYMEVTKVNLDKQNRCETALQEYLHQYSGKYLNELEQFQGKLPTIEVLCEVLAADTERIAAAHGMEQKQIEVGDSPIALFGIGKRRLLGGTNRTISDAKIEAYKEQLNQQYGKVTV